MQNEIIKFIKMMDEYQSFIVASHMNPEGDAVASSLAIAYILNKSNKYLWIYNSDGFPEQFSYLPHFAEVKTTLPAHRNFDMAIIIDCGKIELVGARFKKFIKEHVHIVAEIDHHLTNENFAEVSIVDSTASATGELIYRILKKMNMKIDLPLAKCIYTSIISDTGSFHFANSSPEAFRIAYEMVRLGVKPWEISENLYDCQPVNRLRLLEKALGTLELWFNGRVASIYVTNKMLKETGSGREDTDGLINYPRSLKNVKIALMFREKNDGKTKVSLRGRENLDVSSIAEKFNGGGHREAAAFVFNGNFKEARSAIYRELESYLRSGIK